MNKEMSVGTGLMPETTTSASEVVNTCDESRSVEKKHDDTYGENTVEIPANSPAGQNTGSSGLTGKIEQGENAMATRSDICAATEERKRRADPSFAQGYLDEIKRRKFDRKSKSKLFVGGLVLDSREEFLHENFEKYGEIIDACIVYEKGSNKSRGFGYVTFSNEKDAEEAIKGVDGMRFNGRTLCVEFADDPKNTWPRGQPRGSRTMSPQRGRYPSASPPYRDSYLERDRFYNQDSYYERDRYDRDRDYKQEPYDSYHPPRDPYHPPRDPYHPSRDEYYHLPPRDYRPPDAGPPAPPTQYKDRFGRDIPPPPRREPMISDVDHARLRVNRERLRVPEHQERSRVYRYYKSPSPALEKGDYSDSNSSDDEKDVRKSSGSTAKPRQVSAFPSAYLN